MGSIIKVPISSITNIPFIIKPTKRTMPPTLGADIASHREVRCVGGAAPQSRGHGAWALLVERTGQRYGQHTARHGPSLTQWRYTLFDKSDGMGRYVIADQDVLRQLGRDMPYPRG